MTGQVSRFCLLFSVVFCAIQVFIMNVHADTLCFAALACQPCSDCILTWFYSNPTSAINLCIQYFAYIENKWSSSCQTPTLGCPKNPFVRIVWSDNRRFARRCTGTEPLLFTRRSRQARIATADAKTAFHVTVFVYAWSYSLCKKSQWKPLTSYVGFSFYVVHAHSKLMYGTFVYSFCGRRRNELWKVVSLLRPFITFFYL